MMGSLYCRLTFSTGRIELILPVPYGYRQYFKILVDEAITAQGEGKRPDHTGFMGGELIDRALSLIPCLQSEQRLGVVDFVGEADLLGDLLFGGEELSFVDALHKEDDSLFPWPKQSQEQEKNQFPPVDGETAFFASAVNLLGYAVATDLFNTRCASDVRIFMQEYLNILNPKSRQIERTLQSVEARRKDPKYIASESERLKDFLPAGVNLADILNFKGED
jgi:hypothetical protein